MRILLVNKFFYRKGGAETYFFALAEGLKALGHEVSFFSMHHPDNLPCEQSEYFVSQREYVGKTSSLEKVKAASSLVYSFEAKRKFEMLLEDFKPDVIHMNNVHRQITLSILDAPYLKAHRVPVVYTAHDYILICPAYTMVNGLGMVCDACLDGHFKHAIEKKCVKDSKSKSALAFLEASFYRYHHSYSKINKIIAPSGFMKRKLEQGGYDDGRVVMLQNFLTESQMDMARLVTNNHKFEDVTFEDVNRKPYFLFFGRLSREKGILTLVRAFLSVKDRLGDAWQLRIVGEGPERVSIEQLVAEHHAENRVHLLGYKTGEDLQRQVGNARFSVLCSEWRENMPYSGLESLAAQTPIIGARIGGIPELVVDGETGFQYEAGNQQELAEMLVRAAAVDRQRYETMQGACSKYVDERCKQDDYVQRLVELYESLIDVPQMDPVSTISSK